MGEVLMPGSAESLAGFQPFHAQGRAADQSQRHEKNGQFLLVHASLALRRECGFSRAAVAQPMAHQDHAEHGWHVGKQAENGALVNIIARILPRKIGGDDDRQETKHIAQHRQGKGRHHQARPFPVSFKVHETINRRQRKYRHQAAHAAAGGGNLVIS